MSGTTDIRDVVREKYGAMAEGAGSGAGCCGQGGGCGCGCQGGATETLASLGYTEEQTKAIPEGANLGLGCGNPLAHAQIRFGETVLDLGSGAGIDAFLAAREVGARGRVIGVDMTPAMLSRARENAAKGGFANVEFRLGEIEHLPVADATVDVIISNCVINLSPEKPQVFREAWRALRPGGRMVVSDIVLTRALPEEVRKSVEAYVGCVAGAALKADYLRLVADAGFEDVEVVEEKSYGVGTELLPGAVTEAGAWDAVRSVKVRARKPKN
ncbi:MAG: arsenite methyltransferase [Candidatus Eisenbacteria bacterium]|uniref:Arsenite methyltransferase n=1 Tax=Eiseniibacteriota bacterium TaxID=2212470 RepID=A0A538TGZ2_UNCEI|nr:MAG: arsenite methyltransferase [Candidatus Eisenbacteria bacterium]